MSTYIGFKKSQTRCCKLGQSNVLFFKNIGMAQIYAFLSIENKRLRIFFYKKEKK
jgi:hypothetical protein